MNLKFLILVCITLITAAAPAQMKSILKGRITDCKTNEYLPFVAVTSSNQKVGVVSDFDGNFMLEVPDSVLSLEFRYIGYQTEFFELPKKRPINLNVEICLKDIGYRWDDNLPEILIEGLRTNKPLVAIPASIGFADGLQLNAMDQSSLQNAMNTIPGVIMEQRGYGGSHRINIRGSAFRSPFAVRNIKMYMDGIPLTSPDGQAPLEMVDASELGSIEVIKGPAGSIWGSGNGGVIHMHSDRSYTHVKRFTSSATYGSYELCRTINKYEWGDRKNGISVSHIYQDNPGYRQQEYNHKNQLAIHGTYKPNAKSSFLFYGNYFDGRWALPGGLNAVQADTLPTQASAYSWKNNANVGRERYMLGVSYKYQIDKWTSARTSVYGYTTDKKNPFGTSAFSNGYKVESADGAGLRTDWNKIIRLSKPTLDRMLQLNWGGEYQYEKYHINESSLLNGQADEFRYLYDVGYHSGMAFFSSDLSIDNTVFFNAGVSANKILQAVKGYSSADFLYDTTATWNWALLPRLAVSWQFRKNWYGYVSASSGNANPTVFEMVDYENNAYNLDLSPERGVNLESGIKAQNDNATWKGELNVYQFNLSDAIVSFQDTTSDAANEVYRYSNAGRTVQQGIEWSLLRNWTQFNAGSKFIQIQFQHSGSFYHYVFKDFEIEDDQFDGVQFNGNKIPGVPLMTISNLVEVNFRGWIKLDVQHQWFDKVALNNQNTFWAGAYNLVNLKATASHRILKKLTVQAFCGINNVLNTKYTSFYGLNNEFNRFYNPSPPTNYFGGLSLSWMFADRRYEIFPD